MPISLADAVQRFRANDLAGALRLCRSLLCSDPGDAQVLNLLGVGLFRGGSADGAVQALRRALAVQPGFVEVCGSLGVVLQTTGRVGEGLAAFRRLLALEPASVMALGRAGILWQERGDLDRACDSMRRAAICAPMGNAEAFNLGAIRQAMGEADAASAGFRRLVALEPNGAGGHAALAGALLGEGRLESGAASFRRALRIEPGNADAVAGCLRTARYRLAAQAAGVAALPAGLVIRGPAEGVSGYAHMTNRFVAGFRRRGIPLHLAGLLGAEPWASPLDRPVRSRVLLNFLIPPAVEPVPGLATVVFSMFEGTRIPLPWRRCGDRHDLLIVPTRSSFQAWADSGVAADRLRICPLGVEPESPADGLDRLGLVTADGRPVAGFRRRVLNISDFIPRKNVDGLLRVWLTATAAGDDAVLVLKLGKGNPHTRAAIDALVARTEAAVGRRLAEAAPVVIVDRALDDAAMHALFQAATHYWSLSHGEGWDLPMSKAGAMGLGLIAPRHSAYEDYLDETVAHMIPATVGPAHQPWSREPWGPFFGLDWWEPDETAAAEVIARIVAGRDGPPRDARTRLLERYSWDEATRRLLDILEAASA